MDNELMNVTPEVTEAVEGVVEEATKRIDGESFAIGAAGGAGLVAAGYVLVKKVIIPLVRKAKRKVQEKALDAANKLADKVDPKPEEEEVQEE